MSRFLVILDIMKFNKRITFSTLLLGFLLVTLSGCIKPYDTPEFYTIQPNQTAFLVPLEGDTKQQSSFDSEEFLEEAKVATKRVQIPHRWVKTGRFNHQGEWVGTMRLITVDRTPVTREWKYTTNGDAVEAGNSYISESKDSIKFYISIGATAKVLEDDASKFLYQYAGKTLEEVMDKEVRNRISSKILEIHAGLSAEEVQTSKETVITEVRDDIIPYFKEFGITVSNLGYVGDFKYVNEDIQNSLNAAFNAQNEQKAQTIRNETEIEKAEAEASAIKLRQETLSKTIELREIELQQQFLDTWDGKLPDTYLPGGPADMILNMGGTTSSKTE